MKITYYFILVIWEIEDLNRENNIPFYIHDIGHRENIALSGKMTYHFIFIILVYNKVTQIR